jgi:hypothetical protein
MGSSHHGYKKAQKLNGKNPVMQSNLVEIDLMQKKMR